MSTSNPSANPLVALRQYGQSVWYDNLRRGLLVGGELKKMIDADGLMGVTSNPTIFEKAIAGSTDYSAALTKLVESGVKHTEEIYETLVIEDIQNTCDLFRKLYDETNGIDGCVSLEVSPLLAKKTKETIAEAKRLYKLVGRPNVMIKIPATDECLPAITDVIAAGINVNVTLIFSTEQYKQVALAYIDGLERRVKEGKAIDKISSVASVFVSRIDVAVDAMLEEKIKGGAAYQAWLGKTAIANAQVTYEAFKELFYNSDRFQALQEKGARVQRPLWASTGTKNPKYRDVLYVEALIGQDTVNTMPPATIDAFRDHGVAAATLDGHFEEARKLLYEIDKVVDLEKVYAKLLQDGLDSFAKSFVTLFDVVRSRKQAILQKLEHRQTLHLGKYEKAVKEKAAEFGAGKAVERFWKKDPTLWKSDDEHAKVIKNRLGWIPVIEMMQEKVKELTAFAAEMKKAKFAHVVVLGMGGSSLCPDVFRATFPSGKGFPKLLVLDSTDPGQVAALEKQLTLEKTLFIVASKSGSTLEPQLFFEYFYNRCRESKKIKEAGNHFIAITDDGTQMHQTAEAYKFRRIFVNPSDIGGRYSALSYFGLVPAALMGMDVEKLLERAERMLHANASFLPIEDNPAVMLGIALGTLAKQGRNKLTFITAKKIATFGFWTEQLIAESTGKEGSGIVPVESEVLGNPKSYGNDRVFVYLEVAKSKDAATETKLKALIKAGHPVIRTTMEDVYDMGSEMLRWEIATAFASATLGTNPFDEPNVKESKDNTVRVTNKYVANGKLPEESPVMEDKGFKIFCDESIASAVQSKLKKKVGVADFLKAFGTHIKAGDYAALQAFIPMTPATRKALDVIRIKLRDKYKVAATVGFGPRYLHSTGQLHKGGANEGVFYQITCDDAKDVSIQGRPYSFGVVKAAQAMGDFQSLTSRNYRAVRIHLSKNVVKDLTALAKLV